MDKMIKLDNYYFYLEEYTPNKIQEGESRHSRDGTFHKSVTAEYDEHELIFLPVNEKRHNQLLYILNKNTPEPIGLGENIDFVDDLGNEYKVSIPHDEFDFERLEGEKVKYRWEMILKVVD